MDEVQTILKFALTMRPAEGSVIHHLDSRASVEHYRRKADEVAATVGRGARILDWGCLYGQMTFLLQRRGLRVVPLDIATSRRPQTLCELVGQTPLYVDDPVRLPFSDRSFDAVLSSGTLEHVVDPEASLEEIHRVLRPSGWFIIYNLPNRLSWIEFAGRFRNMAHERRHSLPQARCWLERHGFGVLVARYDDVLPATFKGLPQKLRTPLHAVIHAVAPVDLMLSRLPLVGWFATNLTLMCRKKDLPLA